IPLGYFFPYKCHDRIIPSFRTFCYRHQNPTTPSPFITIKHGSCQKQKDKMRITTISLVGFLLIPLGSLAQDVSIVSPTKDSNIMPGKKLKIVLKIQGTTSSVNRIALSTAFKTTKYHDPTSLGRPYVGSVFLTPKSTDVVLDASKGTYTYEITVPSAEDFLDGFSTPYELTVSDFYFLGATYTPMLKLTSVQVNVKGDHPAGGEHPPEPKGGKDPKAGTITWDPKSGKDPKTGGTPNLEPKGEPKAGNITWDSKGEKDPKTGGSAHSVLKSRKEPETGGSPSSEPKIEKDQKSGGVPSEPKSGKDMKTGDSPSVDPKTGKDPKTGGSPASDPKGGKDPKAGSITWDSKGGKAPKEL
ncbi:hypothetical protein PSHT_07788, partial [Puccinia striiformis]